MPNETRNELITILSLGKSGEETKNYYIKELLQRFEYEIKDQLADLKRKENELQDNLKLLEYVKNELLK